MKTALTGVAIIVTGALLGSFLGRAIGMIFQHGRWVDLLSREMIAGLHPLHLDLGVVDLTFGCLFHFNMMSLVGIAIATLLIKIVL